MSAPGAPSLVIGDVARRLKIAGIEGATLEARLLVAEALSVAPGTLHGVAAVPATAGERQFLDDLVARRINREPIAYITGTREFWSLPFKVRPGVLIPRPDSETVIETVCKAFPDASAPLRILDLGTGSGCLLLALLSEYCNAAGIGIDASNVAVETAQDNADALHLGARAKILKLDWRDRDNDLYADILRARFDVIVANPPYICDEEMAGLMRDVAEYEPRQALAGGADGLDSYREILPLIRNCLDEAGVAVLECGHAQAGVVLNLARDQGFVEGMCAIDLAGVERCVILRFRGEKNLLERRGQGASLAPEGPTK